MVMKSPPVMIPLSGRVSGRASEPSRTRVDDGSGYGTFRGWRLGYLGFSGRRHYIAERAVSGGTRGGHATPGTAGGGAAPSPGVAASSVASVSPLDTVYVSGK